jgi:hypothetical protein
MRAAILFTCLAMLFCNSLAGQERGEDDTIDLTVTWLEFTTADAAVVNSLDRLLADKRSPAQTKTIEYLRQHANLAEEESIAAIVRLGRTFELSKVEGNRTFHVVGSLNLKESGKILVDLKPRLRTAGKKLAPNGQPIYFEGSAGLMADVPLEGRYYYCALGRGPDKSAPETRYVAAIVRVNSVRR